jgi:WD40 repeat protein
MASEGQGSVVLWDVSKGMRKTVLETRFPDAPVTSGLAFSYDGRWLAAGGMGLVSIWQAETGKRAQEPIKVGGFVRSVAFSPDGLHMAAAVWGVGAKLFEKAEGEWREMDTFGSGGVTDAVNSVLFASNDSLAVAGRYGQPYQHGVWFRNLAKKADDFLATGNYTENFGECRALSLSHNSLVLAALCSSGALIAERSDASFYPGDYPRGRFDLFSVSYGISLSNTGKYVAAVDNSGVVHVFGNPIQQEISLLLTPSASVAFRPDGKTLASGLVNGSIALWPTSRRTEAIRLPYRGEVTGLAFSPDDRFLATAGIDETVRIFAVFDETAIQQLQTFHIGPDLSNPVFSPDGRFLAVLDKAALHVIGTKPWKRLTQYDVFGRFDASGFTPDNRMVITAGEGKIHRVDTATWKERIPVIAVSSLSSWVFSPDGRWLATISEEGSLGSHVRVQRRDIWNLATGEETAWKETIIGTPRTPRGPPQGGPQNLIADSEKWTEGNQKSVSSNGALSFNLDRYSSTLTLEDANSKRTIAKLEHDGELIAAAFSPRGRWLATSNKDGTVRLWPLKAEDAVKQACQLLPRNLTREEWSDLHIDGPYRKTCQNLP